MASNFIRAYRSWFVAGPLLIVGRRLLRIIDSGDF